MKFVVEVEDELEAHELRCRLQEHDYQYHEVLELELQALTCEVLDHWKVEIPVASKITAARLSHNLNKPVVSVKLERQGNRLWQPVVAMPVSVEDREIEQQLLVRDRVLRQLTEDEREAVTKHLPPWAQSTEGR